MLPVGYSTCGATWDHHGADRPHLRAAGYETAFTLGGRADTRFPLLTLPRTLVDSTWTASDLLTHLHTVH